MSKHFDIDSLPDYEPEIKSDEVYVPLSSDNISHSIELPPLKAAPTAPDADPEQIDPKFRFRLQQLRLEKGWTETELAAQIGMTPAAISQFENGQRSPSFDSLLKLAETLECTTDFLIRGYDKSDLTELFSDARVHEVAAGMLSLSEEHKTVLIIFGQFLMANQAKGESDG